MVRRIGPLAALLLAGCFSTTQVPKPEGPPLAIAKGAFPHEALDEVQKKYVNDTGRVDYRGLKADRLQLERYLVAVASVSPQSDPDLFPTKEDKLTYWINAYNAYVLYAVTERPEMRSVNDELKDFFYFTKYEFGGETYNLYNLENDVIRSFKEPRIHMAVNCASAGCPELPNEAFMPAKLEEQLAREAKKFCAHPDKVKVEGDKVRASQIFEWYADDFVPDGGPLKFCRKWGRDDLPETAQVEFIPYDWSLNAQPGKALFEAGGAQQQAAK